MATNQSNNVAVACFYKYREKILRFLQSRINRNEDAEDLAQDVFLRLLEYPQEILPETASRLAFAIAGHVLNDYLRHQYVKSSVHSQLSLSQTGITDETSEAIVGRDMQRLEKKRLESMPPQRRLIYMLRIHEGKSTKEIAEALQISPRTAENHFYIGIRQMRDCFLRAM